MRAVGGTLVAAAQRGSREGGRSARFDEQFVGYSGQCAATAKLDSLCPRGRRAAAGRYLALLLCYCARCESCCPFPVRCWSNLYYTVLSIGSSSPSN